LKHALGSQGPCDSSRRGWSWRRSSTTTTIASSTRLGSAGRAAHMTAWSKQRGMGKRDGQEQAARDGRAATARQSGRAAAEWEGCG